MDGGKQAQLHVAGATRRHESPFSDLEVPAVFETPPREFLERWVQPFYNLNLWAQGDELLAALRPVHGEIRESLVRDLLSYFNWRPRITGAYFAAVKRLDQFDQHIGRLLLRSDVCYAGKGYCFALARFNTPESLRSLRAYLDYYLTQPDLWFDQGAAMAALGYLDRANGTSLREQYIPLWESFISNKPNWDLGRDDELFQLSMAAIQRAGEELG